MAWGRGKEGNSARGSVRAGRGRETGNHQMVIGWGKGNLGSGEGEGKGFCWAALVPGNTVIQASLAGVTIPIQGHHLQGKGREGDWFIREYLYWVGEKGRRGRRLCDGEGR